MLTSILYFFKIKKQTKNEKNKTYVNKCCLFAKYYCAGLFFFLYTTDHESQMGSIKNLTYKQSHYWLIGIIETLSPSNITINNAAAKLTLCWSAVNGFMLSSRNKTQTDKILLQPNLCMKSQHASVRIFRFVTHWISTSPAAHQAHIGPDQTKLESTTFGNPVMVLWLAERIKKIIHLCVWL